MAKKSKFGKWFPTSLEGLNSFLAQLACKLWCKKSGAKYRYIVHQLWTCQYSVHLLKLHVFKCVWYFLCSSGSICGLCYYGEKSLLGQGELTRYDPTPGFNPFRRPVLKTRSSRDSFSGLSPASDLGERAGKSPLRRSRETRHRWLLLGRNTNWFHIGSAWMCRPLLQLFHMWFHNFVVPVYPCMKDCKLVNSGNHSMLPVAHLAWKKGSVAKGQLLISLFRINLHC